MVETTQAGTLGGEGPDESEVSNSSQNGPCDERAGIEEIVDRIGPGREMVGDDLERISCSGFDDPANHVAGRVYLPVKKRVREQYEIGTLEVMQTGRCRDGDTYRINRVYARDETVF